MMTKEQIFEEFKIAKEKDIAKSKTKPPMPLKGHMGVGELLFLIYYLASATPNPLR